MGKDIKSKIVSMLDEIKDEAVLNLVMEDIAFYAGKQDTVDKLTAEQTKELDAAIKDADTNETIAWDDFKKEMNEWRKK